MSGDFQRPGQLAYTGHPSVGNIGHMRLTEEGKQVVFANGEKGHVLQHHRVPVLFVKHGVYSIGRVEADSGEQIGVHTGDAVGCLPETLPPRVVADGVQDFDYRVLDALLLNDGSFWAAG
jgi:hypothetical protein